MGATHVTVAICNPAEEDRLWEGEYLVETGAVDCRVPRSALKSIRLQPEGKRSYDLADGSEIQFDVAVGRAVFMGDFVGATILLGVH